MNAGWHLENTFAQGVTGGRMGMYAWEWDRIFEYPRVPPGLKIDTDNPVGVTRALKKPRPYYAHESNLLRVHPLRVSPRAPTP